MRGTGRSATDRLRARTDVPRQPSQPDRAVRRATRFELGSLRQRVRGRRSGPRARRVAHRQDRSLRRFLRHVLRPDVRGPSSRSPPHARARRVLSGRGSRPLVPRSATPPSSTRSGSRAGDRPRAPRCPATRSSGSACSPTRCAPTRCTAPRRGPTASPASSPSTRRRSAFVGRLGGYDPPVYRELDGAAGRTSNPTAPDPAPLLRLVVGERGARRPASCGSRRKVGTTRSSATTTRSCGTSPPRSPTGPRSTTRRSRTCARPTPTRSIRSRSPTGSSRVGPNTAPASSGRCRRVRASRCRNRRTIPMSRRSSSRVISTRSPGPPARDWSPGASRTRPSSSSRTARTSMRSATSVDARAASWCGSSPRKPPATRAARANTTKCAWSSSSRAVSPTPTPAPQRASGHSSVADRKLASVVASTVADVLSRWYNSYTGGRLRGYAAARSRSAGDATLRFRLTELRFIDRRRRRAAP